MRYLCPGCNSRLMPDDLIYPVPELEERILPGEIMPEGACPNCDSLIFEENEIDKLPDSEIAGLD